MAYEVRELDLSLSNELYEQETRARQLMIVLPGAGYNCDKPLLYYSTSLALERGWDVLQIRYDYRKAANDPQEELRSQVIASLRRALAGRPWDTVFLVGKSLGTRAMSAVLESDVLNGYSIKPVWLTPLLKREEVMAAMRKHPGLAVIGTKDPHYVPTKLEEIPGSRVLLIEGADHSLEMEQDVLRSISELPRIIRAISEFLS